MRETMSIAAFRAGQHQVYNSSPSESSRAYDRLGPSRSTLNRAYAPKHKNYYLIPNRRHGRTHTLPQKTQVYLECCDTSIFLMILRSEAPYRVPYFPQIPTFFVRLPYWCWVGLGWVE